MLLIGAAVLTVVLSRPRQVLPGVRHHAARPPDPAHGAGPGHLVLCVRRRHRRRLGQPHLRTDQETTFVDHPDTETTRIILGTFADAAVNGHIGRELPRLLRAAGLTDVSVTPGVNLGGPRFFRAVFHDHVARLQDQGILTSQRASRWWAELDAWTQEGAFLGGAAVFVAAASRPA